MASVPTIARDPRSRASGWASVLASRPLSVALAAVALLTCLRALGTVDADVSWQLWAAHQLNGGARLYRDINEINPPLWFWMGMPVDGLAGLIHVRSDRVLIGVIGSLVALALIATDRLLAPMPAPQRGFVLGYGALVLLAMPWLQLGQREHLALIGALPYAALIAARRTGRAVPSHLALLVAAASALGFALKHYFLLVPILLELWLLVSLGRSWRPLRPETLTMVAMGIVYGAAIALWGSDYFSLALPLIIMAYGLTGAQRAIDLFQPAVLTALATLGLLVAHRRMLRSDTTGLASASIIAATGFAGSYFLQAKGWSYHAVPFAACAAIALAASLTAAGKPRLVVLAAPTLLLLPFWIAAQQAIHSSPRSAEVRRALDGLHPGDPVAFIGSDPSLGWPETLDDGLRYPSRYSSFWMMRAVVKNATEKSPDQKLAQFGRTVVRETVQDYQCMPPERIIVARAEPGEFDTLAFFLRDPHFARLLGHYRPIDRSSVEVFERISPLEPAEVCIRRARD